MTLISETAPEDMIQGDIDLAFYLQKYSYRQPFKIKVCDLYWNLMINEHRRMDPKLIAWVQQKFCTIIKSYSMRDTVRGYIN